MPTLLNRVTVVPFSIACLLAVLTGCQRTDQPATQAVPAPKASAPAPDAPKCTDCIPVTADNFARAESDLYFQAIATKKDGFGKFMHDRTPTPMDKQTVIRMNRDTLYSGAVFDLDAGPVTITLPDAGQRFMSMQVISESSTRPWLSTAKARTHLRGKRLGLVMC
jgi:hypothetical protein